MNVPPPLPDRVRWPLPAPMAAALEQARIAADAGEVPVGAVVVRHGAIVAVAHNEPRGHHDPTAHAEMLAIRRAAHMLGTSRLMDCDLYVTLEPCAMCAGAITHARIARLYYGAADEKGGAVEHGPRLFDRAEWLHRPEIYAGIGEAEAAALLRAFFAERRK
ncbi:nucleoside deaminase [Croceicoccus sp. YJ47]|uniref:nucleoside deaminase n=1 Tax=Croceicoccus sp. YJ47 TaxID=2798724 RepID=UPI0019207772|nr:nucleoside deaminase [Croceicoccus sp. YJ47]QQN74691.1 nucleoside deaminase [Croceicoccus sp. YJ47]